MGDSPLFRAPYLFTVLLGLSLLVYCSFTAFSINVLDENENPHNQPPPWPTLQSPASSRRWRGLKSSSKMLLVSHHPVQLKKKKLVVDVVGGVEPERALQGMGTLFRKGTRSMRELVVAHLSENTTSAHLRLFLRTLHRSGATARADVVLLFPGTGTASSGVAFPQELVGVIVEEEASFQRLLALSNASADTDTSNATLSPFNPMPFKDVEAPRDPEQVMWGNPQRSKPTSSFRYGSIVGFAMQELDAHNEMSGFFDEPPPAHLRRWVCYDMILGMVRSRYKNVILTPVDGVLVLGDAFSPVRRRPNRLYLSGEDESWSDSPPSVYNEELWRKLREKTVVSSRFVMGRVDWVRKLASKMATEIVRIALEEKKKKEKRRRSDRQSSRGCSFFHDKALLNYLVHESSVLGKRVLEHVRIVANKDSVVHSLVGTSEHPLNAVWKRRKSGNYAVIQGLADSERGLKVLASVHDDICRSVPAAASEVYVDCL